MVFQMFNLINYDYECFRISKSRESRPVCTGEETAGTYTVPGKVTGKTSQTGRMNENAHIYIVY